MIIKASTFSILFLLVSNICFSQRLIEYQQLYTVEEKQQINTSNITVALLRDYKDRQKIIKIEYSKEPDRIFLKNDSIKYAYWNLSNFKVGNIIRITTKILIYKNDFNHIKDTTYLSNKDFKKNIKSSGYIRLKNKLIIKTAAKLKGENTIKTVENIFNYVINQLKYSNNNWQENMSNKSALKRGYGDCTEYSGLMISLCRANNIPARYVSGNTLNTSGNLNIIGDVDYHNWLEVYLPNKGWIAFDPTHADCSGKNCNTTFYNMENKYLYYNFKRDIDRYRYHYRGTKNEMIYKIKVKETWLDILKINKELALYYIKKNKFKELNNIITEINKYTPNDYQLYNIKALAYIKQNNVAYAFLNIRKAMSLTKNNSEKKWIHLIYGIYYTKINKPELAISHIKKAINCGMSKTRIKQEPKLNKLKTIKEYKDLF